MSYCWPKLMLIQMKIQSNIFLGHPLQKRKCQVMLFCYTLQDAIQGAIIMANVLVASAIVLQAGMATSVHCQVAKTTVTIMDDA